MEVRESTTHRYGEPAVQKSPGLTPTFPIAAFSGNANCVLNTILGRTLLLGSRKQIRSQEQVAGNPILILALPLALRPCLD